jgi:hypothetical protein
VFFPPPPSRDQTPVSPSRPVAGPHALPGEADLRVFVGPNADFYLRSWGPALTGDGGVRGFNLAAAIIPVPWLLYRRMYAPALLVAAVVTLAAMIDATFPPDANGLRPPVVGCLTTLGILVVCGCGPIRGIWPALGGRCPGVSRGTKPRGGPLARVGGWNLTGAIAGSVLLGLGVRLAVLTFYVVQIDRAEW